MKIKVKFLKLPHEIEEVVSNNESAQSALKRLERGTNDTDQTWFYEQYKENPEKIIEPVVAKLDAMKEWPKIASWDKSKLDKFQPQGRSAPFVDRLESFEEYFEHLTSPRLHKDKVWQKAKKLAVEWLHLNETGAPLSIGEVIRMGMAEDKFGTNSGYPLYIKRKRIEAISHAEKHYRTATRERYPFTTGSRAQMGKVGPLARFIFMASMDVNCDGQRFAAKFQKYITGFAELAWRHIHAGDLTDAYEYKFFFTPWLGWDRVQNVISIYFDKADLRFGADYTKMDQHFNKYHGLEVYDVVKHYFRKEYWDELKESMMYPFTAPILTSLGYVDQEHALLSGSEWTNLIETMYNFILNIYLNLKLSYLKAKILCPMGIGDDQLWFVASSVPMEELKDKILDLVIDTFEAAGLPGNPKKQEGIEDLGSTGFLQRHIWDDYNGPDGNTPNAGVYSLVRNVTSQVFPERYHNDSEYDWKAFAIRVIMIAENCNMHPLFEWYVTDFIAKANPNILRFVRLTDEEIDKKWKSVKNIAGFRPNYNQEKQDRPLREFDTFKLLRKVAYPGKVE